jgi:hypothetical protein
MVVMAVIFFIILINEINVSDICRCGGGGDDSVDCDHCDSSDGPESSCW